MFDAAANRASNGTAGPAPVGAGIGAEDGMFSAVVTVDDGRGCRDLLVRLPSTADNPATGADLYQLLRRVAGVEPPLLTVERTGEALARNVALVNAGLLSGDRLTAVPPRPPAISEIPSDQITLRVLTGPGAGSLLGVRPGHEVGRTTSPSLDDPSVSRQQFRLDVVDGVVTVEDRGAVNITVVNGVTAVPRVPVEVAPGDVIEAGHVSLTLLSGPPVQRDIHHPAFSYSNGSLGFQRAPRAIDLEPEPLGSPPEPPAEPPDRRFPLAAAAVPLVLGAIMALLIEPVYALFVLVSPLMVIWTFLDDRRTGRRAYARQISDYHQALSVHRLALADHIDQRAAWQRRRTPSLTQISRWIRTGSKELWGRRPDHDDFLVVAVGQVDRPVSGEALSDDVDLGKGASELREAARTLLDQHRVEPSAPVTVDLGANPVLGITGEDGQTAAIAASIVAQLVGLRSPRDVHLYVLAPGRESLWSWTTWLPHASSRVVDDETRPLHVAGSDDEAAVMFRRLEGLLAERRDRADQRLGGGDEGPHIVVVVHPPVGLAPAAVSAFLAAAPNHGFSILNLAMDRVQLPAEVDLHIEASGCGSMSELGESASLDCLEVTTLATNQTERQVTPWRLNPAQAEELARDLAPLVDLNYPTGDHGLPDFISFQDVTGRRLPVSTPDGVPPPSQVLTADRLAGRWTSERPGLLAVIGTAADGPLALDLKSQGPHALVAGTTGSGKSEFLRSMLAGLAVNYSPADINFILIDYKGGAAFRQCRLLPHTVGFVTDLDDRLAERALTSLRAELRRREELLARAGVSDLEQMASSYRHTADQHLVPASLVVVIDEFAALKSEVPEFVDGLVDVAQRGRSMGVHMVLATQKPAGVITPQIDANTNIRVALRVAGEHESSDIIGEPTAASISTANPGRAFLKIGGGDPVVEFQSAYVGGSVDRSELRQPELFTVSYGRAARPVPLLDVDPQGSPSPATEEQLTELEALVDLAREAWSKYGAPDGQRLHEPWLPPLPEVVSLPDLLLPEPTSGQVSRRAVGHVDLNGPANAADTASDPLSPVIGLVDVPWRQAQIPMSLDLAHAGHVAVYGTNGSGKSTLVRSLACSLTAGAALDGRPGPDIVVVDGGGALADLAELPLVTDVVAASDGEQVQLLVDIVLGEVERRRSGGVHQPWLLLIDGFSSFWTTLQSLSFGRPADDVVRALGEMPGVGMHAVMTANQRSSIPHQCLGPVGLRLVQRMSSADEYRSLDVRTAPLASTMPPGRTLVVGVGDQTVELQVAAAFVDDVVDGVADESVPGSIAAGSRVTVQDQIDAVSRLAVDAGDMLADAGVEPRRPVISPLPVALSTCELARHQHDHELTSGSDGLASIPIGLSPGGRVAAINLADNASLLVVGPPQSGRTAVLRTIRAQTEGLVGEHRVVAVKRSSPAADEPGAVTSNFGSVFQSWADELADRVDRMADGEPLKPIMILIDDADDLFDDAAVAGPLTELVLNGRDGAVMVVATATVFRTVQAYETWIRALRSAGYGIVLQPEGDRDEDVFECRFPRGVPTGFPPGRGYLVDRSNVTLAQVAEMSEPAEQTSA